jgi:hypothetical protein
MSARLPIAAAALALTAGTLLGACGGGPKASSTTTTTPNGRGAAVAAFRACMASHGFKLPARLRTPTSGTGSTTPRTGDGGGGFFGGQRTPFTAPPGVDQQKYDAAVNACRSKLPAFGNGADNAQFRTAFTAYATCLKNHGVQGIGDVTSGRQALANVDRASASFQAADQACQALRPTRSTTTTSAGA